MENSKKTQFLTLSLIATLLSLTPLLSSTFRSTYYLYFIINVLIVILGIETGFLSSSSSSSSNNGIDALEGDNKNSSYTSSNFIVNTTKTTCLSLKTVVENSIPLKKIIVCADEVKNSLKTVVENTIPVKKIIVCADEVKNTLKTVVEKSIPVKKIIVCADEVKKLIKKCPSRPSLFFIDGDESEAESEDDEEVEVYEEEEELFVKAEKFIGNFYKQLKMQREESWNKIHGYPNNGLLVN
ncbi:uncharacterized protein LOC110723887 [Chenopodium quinoa]|uniref:uncharacterized protein LOC110723887 n=1 Tax=Chenopodium quinoa TaxID=63459 RepID=UPI000B78A221|nr:uncharacterized protein LOC110723887 [Chenopodium quinoa]